MVSGLTLEEDALRAQLLERNQENQLLSWCWCLMPRVTLGTDAITSMLHKRDPGPEGQEQLIESKLSHGPSSLEVIPGGTRQPPYRAQPFPCPLSKKSSGLSSCSSEQRGLRHGQRCSRRQEGPEAPLSIFFMLVSLWLAHRWCSINVCWNE